MINTQFRCCLSSVTKFIYTLKGMVLADLIICGTVLLHLYMISYKILYTKRVIQVYHLQGGKKNCCYLYSCTVNYWCTITSSMFMSQLCNGMGIEICSTALTFVETHCVHNPWHPQQIGPRVAVWYYVLNTVQILGRALRHIHLPNKYHAVNKEQVLSLQQQ